MSTKAAAKKTTTTATKPAAKKTTSATSSSATKTKTSTTAKTPPDEAEVKGEPEIKIISSQQQQPPPLQGYNQSQPQVTGYIPAEVVSNRVLTHFDETTGVAISRNEVDKHLQLGNVVSPLTDAYQARYDRLRVLLTSRLLPKREEILQLRRMLQNTAVEVDAQRRNIERETLNDTEQILERLRGKESMRQSSIRHQILQLENELQSIERIVRRVERANLDDYASNHGLPPSTINSSNILLTSSNPVSAPLTTVKLPKASSMVELIHEFADLSSSIDRLSTKQLTVQVDFPTDDFPRETAERLEVLSRCDKYLHAVNVKDQLLYLSLQEKGRLEKELADEKKLSQEYAHEITQWAQMTQEVKQQLAGSQQENQRLNYRIAQLTAILRDHNIHVQLDQL